MHRRLFIRAALAIVLAAPLLAAPLAHAQDNAGMPHLQPTDMGQFPSLLQATGVAAGGAPNTQFQLRCGYAMNGAQVAPDSSEDDLALKSPGAYTRYQYIDGSAVITGLDPTKPEMPGVRAVKVEAIGPTGAVKAKSCLQITQTDTLQNCVAAAPFVSPQQAAASINALETQCGAFLQQSQINPAGYNAQKAFAWKAKLSETLAMIEQ